MYVVQVVHLFIQNVLKLIFEDPMVYTYTHMNDKFGWFIREIFKATLDLEMDWNKWRTMTNSRNDKSG